jgi:hypothetical protein
MPRAYREPGGSRKLEFWVTGRGAAHKAFISVPHEWSDDEIRDELEDWREDYCPTSDYVRYGWNDESDYGSRK